MMYHFNVSALEKLAEDLASIVNEFMSTSLSLGEAAWVEKPYADRWSRKEILGHLIDSANNNIQRFVRGTYENHSKIVYDQNQWVRAQHYQDAPVQEMITLWKLLNLHIVRILSDYPIERIHITFDVGPSSPELRNMKEIASSYLEHLKHHLHQILE